MGRKRIIVLDTQVWLLAVVVHLEDIQDRDGCKLALQLMVGLFSDLRRLWADRGYAGDLGGRTHPLGTGHRAKKSASPSLRCAIQALDRGAGFRLVGTTPQPQQRLRGTA